MSRSRRPGCLHACQMVGAVPLTRKALQLPMVQHEVFLALDGSFDNLADPEARLLNALEQRNEQACLLVSFLGFDGKQLCIEAP